MILSGLQILHSNQTNVSTDDVALQFFMRVFNYTSDLLYRYGWSRYRTSWTWTERNLKFKLSFARMSVQKWLCWWQIVCSVWWRPFQIVRCWWYSFGIVEREAKKLTFSNKNPIYLVHLQVNVEIALDKCFMQSVERYCSLFLCEQFFYYKHYSWI
jgi:hypothetical protein